MADLLNDFLRESGKEKHLKCWTRLIERARPYTLDDDATELITELSSGDTIASKLPIYRILARLPFDVVWLEFPYLPRFNKRRELNTVSANEKPEDAPDTMGWIMERITETMWRATTVVRYSKNYKTGSGRHVDTFCATHVISTEGPANFHSFARDPVINRVITDINKNPIWSASMWGFRGSELGNFALPGNLAGSNAIDIPPSWEPIINRKINSETDSEREENIKKYVTNACQELMGDLRFLVAALATINSGPVITTPTQKTGQTMMGGKMRPYLINRIVTISIPKGRGRTNKVLKALRMAERHMRRHEVAGYWKNVRFGGGRVERRWINNYMRGDASLGFVRQEREVVTN